LVITAKIDNALRITAVDAKAAQLSLKPGMALADARAMVPHLQAIEADNDADRKLLEAIADWCDRYTPFVAIDPPHGLLLDVTGATHLFGGEAKLLATACDALAKQRFSVQGALAGTATAARALAHYAPGTIVPKGEEACAIASLPIAALDLDPVITHAFRRAGLKTVGQVGGRTRNELTARFGKDMVARLDNALGKSAKPISPRRALPDYMAEHRFAEPVVTEEVIRNSLFSLGRSLSRLLEQRGEGARTLEAIFFRADGIVRRLQIQTGWPTRDAAIIERLFRERLASLSDPLDPGFGFDLIRLEALRAERDPDVTASFDKDDNAAKEIAFLVDRLSTRLGAHRVLSFAAQDTHIPEAAAVTIPAQQQASVAPRQWPALRNRYEAPRRPLRLFTTPEPIEVTAAVPDGPPIRFRWRRVLHTVTLAEGPERIAMEWWRSETRRPTRDYFRVEDEAGLRLWVYRDGLYGRETMRPRWFVHGLFA
jgi:protein ImuB